MSDCVFPQYCVEKQSVAAEYQCSFYRRASVQDVEFLFTYKIFFLCLLFVYLCVLALIQYAGITSIYTAEYQLFQPFMSKTALKYSLCIREVHYMKHKILITLKCAIPVVGAFHNVLRDYKKKNIIGKP